MLRELGGGPRCLLRAVEMSGCDQLAGGGCCIELAISVPPALSGGYGTAWRRFRFFRVPVDLNPHSCRCRNPGPAVFQLDAGLRNRSMLDLAAQQLSGTSVLHISTILGLPSIITTTWVSFRAWISRSEMLSMLGFMLLRLRADPSPRAMRGICCPRPGAVDYAPRPIHSSPAATLRWGCHGNE